MTKMKRIATAMKIARGPAQVEAAPAAGPAGPATGLRLSAAGFRLLAEPGEWGAPPPVRWRFSDRHRGDRSRHRCSAAAPPGCRTDWRTFRTARLRAHEVWHRRLRGSPGYPPPPDRYAARPTDP